MNSLLIAGLIVSVIASLLTAYGRVFRTKHALAVGVNALSNMIHHHKRDKRDHVKIKEGLMFASMEIYLGLHIAVV
jgi:uncharacterized membrane protein YphA (DoxX/SURF4 family)